MIARVFPSRTAQTPVDEYAFVGDPPLFLPPDITEVHVSVTFSWDLPEAERLCDAWAHVAPVKMGGPATGQRGEEFTPGMYVKKGVTFTSRGCPNNCWFCIVPKRDGVLRELPIQPGNIVQDDNLLACSEKHIRAVFDMLKTQNGIKLSGGLEAKRLKPWHVELFEAVKVQEAFFAFDTPDDWEPLVEAQKILAESRWYTPKKCRCFCLIGYPRDTMQAAEKRLRDVLELGYYPYAMLWRDPKGQCAKKDPEWAKLQRAWLRPAMIYTRLHPREDSTRKIFDLGAVV